MVRFLFRHLKGYRLLVVVAIALTFAQVGASLLVAFPLKFILDKLVNQRDPHFPLAGLVLGVFDQLAPAPGGHHSALAIILFATSLLVALGLLSAGASYVQLYFAAFIGQNLSARLRQKLFEHLQHLSLSWHGQQKTGDLVQRLIGNVADIEKLVTDGLVDLLASILTLVGMVLVMVLANWQFTLFSMLIVPALFVVVLVYTRSIKATTRRAAQAAGQVAEVAAEDIAAITEVKAFTLEGRESRRFGARLGQYRAAGLRAGGLQAQFTPLVMLLSAVGTAIVTGVGAYVIAGHSVSLGVLTMPGGSLTVGTLTVFLAYLKQLYQPMRDLSKLTYLTTVAAAGAERIQDVLAQAPEVLARPGGAPAPGAPRLQGEIRYEHVTFGYLPERPVLEDISLHIPAGRKVALVGLSGSGKTTLVQLMPRFYELWAGTISIDGVDQRSYPLEVLRQNISLVLPESVLFEGTIRDNIALGRPGASEAQIIDAARKAHMHETILALPGGYEARVREQGKNFSSGQRQRLAIARAILRDTPILILDEPTASLDVEAEAEVMHALETLVVGRTVLTISHRLSTLGHVDEIIVLHKGRIAERGTFEELKDAGGVFAWLLAEQNRYNLDRRKDQGGRLLHPVRKVLRPARRPAYVAPPRAPAANGRRPRPNPVAPVGGPAGGRDLDGDGPPPAAERPDAPLPRGRAGPDEVFSRRHDGCAG
jgi:ABC-type multidrug transport system fused ATPase/permease subunit